MGKKYDAPPAPDYDKMLEQTDMMIEASERGLSRYLKFGREALRANQKVTDKILGVQLPAMQQEADAAARQRKRYEREGIPFERDYLQRISEYDTPERREQRAAEAGADVRTASEAGKRNEIRRLAALGLDPSQVTSASHAGTLEAGTAAAQAGAMNRARREVEAQGLALGGEAVNIYRGLPAQTAQSYATATNAATSAGGQQAGQTAGAIGFYKGAGDFTGQQAQMLHSGYNVANSIYGNQLMGARDQAAANAAPFQALGQLGGAALGYKFFAEGGTVEPEMSPSRGALPDDVKAAVTVGEHVVPEDVVRWYGEQKFYKMTEQARKQRAEMQDGAIPAGAGEPPSRPSTPALPGMVEAQPMALPMRTPNGR